MPSGNCVELESSAGVCGRSCDDSVDRRGGESSCPVSNREKGDADILASDPDSELVLEFRLSVSPFVTEAPTGGESNEESAATAVLSSDGPSVVRLLAGLNKAPDRKYSMAP